MESQLSCLHDSHGRTVDDVLGAWKACLLGSRYLSAQGRNQRKEMWMEKEARKRRSTDPEFQTKEIHRPGRGQAQRTRQYRPTAHGPRATRATTKATVSVSIRFPPSSDVDTMGPSADQVLDRRRDKDPMW